MTKTTSSTGSYTLTVTHQHSGNNTTLANAVMIPAGKPTNVSISSGQMRYYSFTPPTTGNYVFESTDRKNACDPYGVLYSSTGTQLAYNDDGGTDTRNFKITYNLTAGTPYIIGARLYSTASTATGSYTLTIASPSGTTLPMVQEYLFDSNGNRLSIFNNGLRTDYTYDKNDRLLTERAGTNAVSTYTYDNNGNMTAKSGSFPFSQTFDSLNRMTSHANNSVYTITPALKYCNYQLRFCRNTALIFA